MPNGNFPVNISNEDWARELNDDQEEEFDPSCDDGGYSQGDDY